MNFAMSVSLMTPPGNFQYYYALPIFSVAQQLQCWCVTDSEPSKAEREVADLCRSVGGEEGRRGGCKSKNKDPPPSLAYIYLGR